MMKCLVEANTCWFENFYTLMGSPLALCLWCRHSGGPFDLSKDVLCAYLLNASFPSIFVLRKEIWISWNSTKFRPHEIVRLVLLLVGEKIGAGVKMLSYLPQITQSNFFGVSPFRPWENSESGKSYPSFLSPSRWAWLREMNCIYPVK